MEQSNDQSLRLAVLIDADNASRTAMRDVMAEIAVYGTPTIKRIYGDWTTPNMASWKPILLENAITPIQQYSYTTGKNSTDSAMIIDAMDILYTGQCDGFVLVSSDSDFTRLATRLREAGKKVIGMGEKKTPSPFIVACDKFIYIEVIRAAAKDKAAKPEPAPEPEPEHAAPEDPLAVERARALAELRRLDENIEDAKLSAQIVHMEEVTGKIFDIVAGQPAKLPQLRRFLNYYLPTTLKLLNAYDRMGAAGVEGANIDGTMGRIDAMMDKVVEAFDKQLDALFADEALDISTDITVLEQMLAQEGLGGMQMGQS